MMHQVASSLPAVGRILLQTGARDTARFQQAVGAALAHQLGASLLVCTTKLHGGCPAFLFLRSVEHGRLEQLPFSVAES